MPKILFIEPKASYLHIFSRFPIPRLGGALLGTMARRQGWEAEVIFEEITPLNLKRLPEADLVGISSITSTATRAYRIADVYKQKGVPVLMGGPHITFLPDEALAHSDFVIRGEGEIPFAAFMKAFEQGKGWPDVPNLSFRQGEEIVHNPDTVQTCQFENLPFPDLSLIHSYMHNIARRIVPVETSRGCPYKCEFCSVTRLFGRRMRFRPIDETVEELKKYCDPRSGVFFVDDNFAARPERTKQLLESMMKAGIRLNWTAQVRTDAVRDKELLELMRRSGCASVYTGIETINPVTLRNMKKKQEVEEVSEAIAEFHKYDIRVHGMFIIGFDEDDKSVARKTVRYAEKVRLNTAQFIILTPLPGTPVYESMLKERRILTNEWSLYDGHHVVYRPRRILPFDLQKMQIKAHQKFYSWVKQLKRLLRFEILELVIAHYASDITREWKRLNRFFIRWLKRLSKSIQLNKSISAEKNSK